MAQHVASAVQIWRNRAGAVGPVLDAVSLATVRTAPHLTQNVRPKLLPNPQERHVVTPRQYRNARLIPDTSDVAASGVRGEEMDFDLLRSA